MRAEDILDEGYNVYKKQFATFIGSVRTLCLIPAWNCVKILNKLSLN